MPSSDTEMQAAPPGQRILVVVGSSQSGSTGAVVGSWVRSRVEQCLRQQVPVVYTSDLGLGLDAGRARNQEERHAAEATSKALSWADGVVMVTPEYNKSFPATLKTFIDWHLWEWAAKPVSFVSYGGTSRGLRAVEHLRTVLSEVHAVTLRDGVSLDVSRQEVGAGLTCDAATNGALEQMLGYLTWWSVPLATARSTRPYPRRSHAARLATRSVKSA